MARQFSHLKIDRAATTGKARRLLVADANGDPTPDPDEDAFIKWLTRLNNFYGVPFNYLVPDARMLPPESIRFFFVDPKWIDAAMHGAASVGEADSLVPASLSPHIRPHLGAPRHRIFTGAYPAFPKGAPGGGEPKPVTGFLLRSAVASGWPMLAVDADGVDGQAVPIIRFEFLAPTILFALFDGQVKTVRFHLPVDGLHFGFSYKKGTTQQERPLRKLGDGGDPGAPLPRPPDGKGRGSNVVAVDEMAASLKTATLAPTFTAAEFAFEMVTGVQQVPFDVAGAKP